jgi:hypothetical protein
METLIAMGFSAEESENALRLFDGNVEGAADMLLNAPPLAETSAAKVAKGEETDSRVDSLIALGLDTVAAKRALDAAGGHLERAAELLFAGGGTLPVEPAAPSRSDALAGASPHGRRPSCVDRSSGKVQADPKSMTIESFAARVTFDCAAFARPPERVSPIVPDSSLKSRVASIVSASVPDAEGKRNTRGEKSVLQSMTECYTNGLHTHGPAVNDEVVPAFQYIVFEMSKLDPKNPKRVSNFRVLTEAFEDCQQVQAREILRMYGDLTSQNASLENQLKYSLVRLKEAALNRYITQQHPKCDLDYRQVQAHQQRPHLFSAYVCMLADALGLDTVEAKHDRFLSQAKNEVGRINVDRVMAKLREDMPIKEWLQTLLADINNQAPSPDRIIDRDCIFTWVRRSMSQESTYTVFYDEDRAHEFVEHDPKEPNRANMYQPFLSCKVLVDILIAAKMITWRR